VILTCQGAIKGTRKTDVQHPRDQREISQPPHSVQKGLLGHRSSTQPSTCHHDASKASTLATHASTFSAVSIYGRQTTVLYPHTVDIFSRYPNLASVSDDHGHKISQHLRLLNASDPKNFRIPAVSHTIASFILT
jgi:hypothetical protein